MDCSIKKLLKQLCNGRVTSKNIVEETINRIELYNELNKAFIEYDPTYMLKQAHLSAKHRENSTTRILDSIPVAVKDTINTMHYPTQRGNPSWNGYAPNNDARAIYCLHKHGAVIAGKTVTSELAFDYIYSNQEHYFSGEKPASSLYGSAIADATGMVPMALETQTTCSIVHAASLYGIFGCKPSFGLIPRTGVLKTADTLDSIGFLVRHAEDMILVLDALRVRGLDYPISNTALSDSTRQCAPTEKPWRVVIIDTYKKGTFPEVRSDKLSLFADKLSLLPEIEVIKTNLPDSFNSANKTHDIIYKKSLAYYFADEYQHSELTSKKLCDFIFEGLSISPQDYKSSLDEQASLCKQMDDLFSYYDIIISLAGENKCRKNGADETPNTAILWTLTHLPVVCAPVLRDDSEQSFNIQISARKYNDYQLFRFIDLLCNKNILQKSARNNN